MIASQGVVFFCEDVREEIGEKLSYMGVLGPEVWVMGPLTLVNCIFLFWTSEREVSVKAEFEAENAPEGFKLRPGFEQIMQRPEGDTSERWMLQMKGRYALKIGKDPFQFTARFHVGSQTYWNSLVLDPNLPDDFDPSA